MSLAATARLSMTFFMIVVFPDDGTPVRQMFFFSIFPE